MENIKILKMKKYKVNYLVCNPMELELGAESEEDAINIINRGCNTNISFTNPSLKNDKTFFQFITEHVEDEYNPYVRVVSCQEVHEKGMGIS